MIMPPATKSCSQRTRILCFSPREAMALGLKEAIVVARLRFWLERSKNSFKGRPWVYNTYNGWQRQFPFWSLRTVKTIFLGLEKLGVVESTQRFNKNRWNKMKWYTLDENALAALTDAGAIIDDTETDSIDDTPSGPLEGAELASSFKTVGSARRSSNGTRMLPTESKQAWSDVDTAFENIPEAERRGWEEVAKQAFRTQGTPYLESCTPAVKSEALRLWEAKSQARARITKTLG